MLWHSDRNTDRNRKSVGKLEILHLLGEQSPLRLNESHGNRKPRVVGKGKTCLLGFWPESRDKEKGGENMLSVGPLSRFSMLTAQA